MITFDDDRNIMFLPSALHSARLTDFRRKHDFEKQTLKPLRRIDSLSLFLTSKPQTHKLNFDRPTLKRSNRVTVWGLYFNCSTRLS